MAKVSSSNRKVYKQSQLHDVQIKKYTFGLVITVFAQFCLILNCKPNRILHIKQIIEQWNSLFLISYTIICRLLFEKLTKITKTLVLKEDVPKGVIHKMQI
jgi:hypothetical protein